MICSVIHRRVPGIAAAALLLAACGAAKEDDRAADCASSEEPPEAAAYANDDVAFAAPESQEVQSARSEGPLPWFAKFGLYVRGNGTVVVRVPSDRHVRIVGWGGGADEPREATLVESTSPCWTAYPGGLAFAGRQCVRVQVDGPGGARGSAVFGLRRDC
jgi:hypothetical protein